MNYYFKLPSQLPSPHFLVHVGEVNFLHVPMETLKISDKAWAELDDGTIKVIKDRDGDMSLDLKEFVWVKLGSVRIN